MFTGIIREVGRIVAAGRLGNGRSLKVAAERLAGEMAVGDSIAVNGVCLTATEVGPGMIRMDVIGETISKSTLGSVRRGGKVNLETAIKSGGAFGGHFVQGHVDCVGTIDKVEKRRESWNVWISHPPRFNQNVIIHGSIAIDGVSLTVAGRSGGMVMLAIIPHTWKETLFHTYRTGTRVNIEFDMIGKYVHNAVASAAAGGMSTDRLREMGY